MQISFIEDREIIKAILKHLGVWFVKSRPTPKAHAPPALNQHGSGPAGYVLDHFSQLPRNDHLHRDPDYPWDAYLQSQAKMGNRGRKEPVCLDEPQNSPRSLAEWLKTSPPHLYPQIPPNPC